MSTAPDTPPIEPVAAPEVVTLVRIPALVTLVVGVIATIAGTVLAGGKGLLGGILGTVVVVGFFAAGQLIVGRVLRTNPALGLNVALLVYIVQIGVLLVLLLVLKNASFFAPKVFAFTVMACVLAWVLGSVFAFARHRQPTIVPGSAPPGFPIDADADARDGE
ncbi:MAG: hypothetical protein ACH36H_09550 [Candidatus Nanopelagicales bacterium]